PELQRAFSVSANHDEPLDPMSHEPPPSAVPRTRVALSDDARATLNDLARRAYPHEACGLLVGRRRDHVARADEVTQSRNLEISRAHDRYTLDPVHLLEVETDANRRGLEVLGVWHTHPDHPARPSETDREGAWEGWSYVIVSVVDGAAHDLRSWTLVEGDFVEEEVTS
ncbi:MAG: M67 family metallopeptidase, partial [Planctomycetota bacterium]